MIQKFVPLVALYKLSKGLPTPFHLEDIAIKSKEISPSTFTWAKYKEHIDLRQVMRTLDELRKQELIIGKNTTAWTLTSEGIKFVENSDLLDIRLKEISKKKTGIYARELIRIENSEAFISWKDGKTITLDQVSKLLRIDNYSSENQRIINITKLEQAIKTIDGYEGFLDVVKKVLTNGEGDLV
tara:strand:+ start:441 stop:992 length:552 start_codon:yes stop_codon:yes gene_type:complete